MICTYSADDLRPLVTLHYIFLTSKLSDVEEKILMANKNRLTVELIPTTFTK